MIKDFFVLLKYEIIDGFGINKLTGKEGRKEQIKYLLMGFVILFAMFSIMFDIGLYYNYSAQTLSKLGLMKFIIYMSIITSSAMVLFTSIYKAQGVMFYNKDYDTMFSWPIRKSNILLSKLVYLLGINYVFSAIVFIPSLIVYGMYFNMSIYNYIYATIGFVLLPLLPTLLALLLAFIVAYVASKFKKSNLITIGGTFVTIGLITVLTSNGQKLLDKIISNSTSIEMMFKRIYSIGYYYTDAIINLNNISIIKMSIYSIIPSVILFYIFSFNFSNIVSRLSEQYINGKFSSKKLKNIKEKSQFNAMFVKEVRRYFSSPMYVVNTIVGPVIYTMLAVTCIFVGPKFLNTVLEMNVSSDMIPKVLLLLIGFICAMTSTTSPSISLEGNKLWIIKSMPIKALEIFKAKIALNLIILIPVMLIDNVILKCVFKLTNYDLMYMSIFTVIISVIVSVTGIIVNLYFPKFNWKSEVLVVKQSVSVLITMLINAIFVAIPAIIYYNLKIANYYNFLILTLVGYLILLILEIRYLRINGQKLFNKLC